MEHQKWVLEVYVQASGKKPFEEWLHNLKDGISRSRIRTRLDKVAVGNGINELRLTFGPGFRISMQ